MAPLDLTGDELRAALATATDYVADFVDRLPNAPVLDDHGLTELLDDPALRREPPEYGRPLDELLRLVDRAAAKGINSASPGALAYTPGGGLVSAAIADLVANAINRYTGQAAPAPALVAMELDVLSWLRDLFSFPASTAGVLTTGGSMATLSAVITARAAMLPANFLNGTLYVTSQTHHATAKAAKLAGFPDQAVRMVPVDSELRMDPFALQEAIQRDREAGMVPFFVTASAGTTNTGTIDPLPALADVASVNGLWLHVDAAYGGFFHLTSRGRQRMDGIERADSLALDPHKSMFLPFGTGCLLVREGSSLASAHYLADLRGASLPDFSDYGPELTREFRGLRMWLPLHLHGVGAFRAALDEKLDLAEYVYKSLSSMPSLSVQQVPDLSVIVFKCRTAVETKALLDRVNASGRVALSSTRIHGELVARMCVLSFRTGKARVDEALELIREQVS
ncbi:pyridoxal phosphate-dependent decarboxylase family protein [Tenggerimyces flavus]|uniref:Pyridoxal phosphate-dependent decarboxylase family protein n=1 Tax=Tenggerimyces flavus TaxID=1708749 RepID=A0ABV7Y2G9_9ACTN|nr:aminotransferase class V-fold PLP-dependent enzyme [Tenggerimyces flavus]MBM7790857.1 aromatic-L-amino-acid decarboxylase [Tenggerimyces flavus]